MNVNKKQWVINAFYPILFLNAFLTMFGFQFYRFLIFPLVLLFVIISIGFINRKSDTGSNLVKWFLIFNLLSILFYFYNGRPLDCFISMLFPFIVPLLFFFWGNNEMIKVEVFFKIFVVLCFGAFAYGLYLYAVMPSYYLSYLTDIYNNAWHGSGEVSEESVYLMSRFSSFFGTSYAISYLSVPCICIAAELLKTSKSKIEKWFYITAIGLSWLAAILCQQRVAMVVSSVYLLILLFYGQKRKKIEYFLLGLVLILPILYFTYGFFSQMGRLDIVSEMLTGRMERMNMNDAYEGSRTYQYVTTIERMENPLLGDGLGAASSFARKYRFAGVSDGEYVRIFVENGIIGICLFITLLVATIKKIIKNREQHIWIFLVVLYFILASFVSNSLSINMLYAPIFWFCMGRIWLLKKVDIKVKTNI